MKFTFGKTKAAQRLETLVADKPVARRQLTSLLSKYSEQLIKVVGAKDPTTVRQCWELLRDYTLRRIDVKRNLSGDMKTYAKNVVVYRHRVHRKEFDELILLIKTHKEKKRLTSGGK